MNDRGEPLRRAGCCAALTGVEPTSTPGWRSSAAAAAYRGCAAFCEPGGRSPQRAKLAGPDMRGTTNEPRTRLRTKYTLHRARTRTRAGERTALNMIDMIGVVRSSPSHSSRRNGGPQACSDGFWVRVRSVRWLGVAELVPLCRLRWLVSLLARIYEASARRMLSFLYIWQLSFSARSLSLRMRRLGAVRFVSVPSLAQVGWRGRWRFPCRCLGRCTSR